ncbi:MAG: DUF5808 domain-containing protein [Candidatus Acidiferrales bacterium]
MSQISLPGLDWFYLADIVAMGGFFYCLPNLTRRDVFFAVTVPSGFRSTPEGRSALRIFRVWMFFHTLIALAILGSGIWRGSLLITMAAIYWQIFGALLAFLRARKQVMPYAVAPSTAREASLGPRAPGLLSRRLLQIGPFVILAVAAVILALHWQQIPARFPDHWGLDGRPNGWATRTFMGVFGILISGAAVCVGIALLAYAVVHWSRHINASGGEAAHEDHFRQVQLAIILTSEYFIALMFSWGALLPLRRLPESMPGGFGYILAGTLVYVIAILAVAVRTGQGGSNLGAGVMRAEASAAPASTGAAPIGDRTPDACWKLGVFYINRDDPAVLVEKCFGFGYTLNFGNPRSWALLAAFILVPLAVSLLIVHKH